MTRKRRHTNTNGRRQIKTGKTAIKLRKLGRILIKKEGEKNDKIN